MKKILSIVFVISFLAIGFIAGFSLAKAQRQKEHDMYLEVISGATTKEEKVMWYLAKEYEDEDYEIRIDRTNTDGTRYYYECTEDGRIRLYGSCSVELVEDAFESYISNYLYSEGV